MDNFFIRIFHRSHSINVIDGGHGHGHGGGHGHGHGGGHGAAQAYQLVTLKIPHGGHGGGHGGHGGGHGGHHHGHGWA